MQQKIFLGNCRPLELWMPQAEAGDSPDLTSPLTLSHTCFVSLDRWFGPFGSL